MNFSTSNTTTTDDMSPSPVASTSAVPLEEPIDADMEIAAALASEGPAEEEEEEYEIEEILGHETGRFFPGELAFLVSWKGYGEEDNSWVREVDAEGAREIIKEYWAKQAKTTVKKTSPAAKGRKSQIKKRSSPKRALRAQPRRSEARTGSPSADEADESVDVRLHEIANDPTLDDDEKARLEKEHLEQQKLERMRKKYGRIANWDEVVKKIEAVERNDQGKLIMFVQFSSGDRLAFESTVCHHRCPLKVIQFYESHLRFKTSDGQQIEYAAPSPAPEAAPASVPAPETSAPADPAPAPVPEANGHDADTEMTDAAAPETQLETDVAPIEAPTEAAEAPSAPNGVEQLIQEAAQEVAQEEAIREVDQGLAQETAQEAPQEVPQEVTQQAVITETDNVVV